MTLSDLQSQILLATGHGGISAKVTKWANRVCQDVATRVFWMQQIGVGLAHHATAANATHTTRADLHAFSMQTPNASLNELIAPYAVDQVTITTNTTGTFIGAYERPLIRVEHADLYQIAAGSTPVTSSTSSFYAMVRGNIQSLTATAGGTIIEDFVAFPFPATTASTVQALGITYLGSPLILDSDEDTNWMMQRYPRVVLAGVLRYARLYLNDVVGYLKEKAEFENGIADMVRVEEVASANAPVMGGVDNAILGRLQ